MPDFTGNQFNIDAFSQNFKTGARAYLFYYEPNWPDAVKSVAPTNSRFLVRTTSLPMSSFEEILTGWQGFDYKTAGKRIYNPFVVTFNTDLEAKIRKAFLAWQNLILNPETNHHALPEAYMKEQSINLLGLDFETILRYKLQFAWPMEVGDLALDYMNTTDFAQFDVTFNYTYLLYDD